ncbi:MAG: shikimate kinase [Bacteroidales bacterium]|jgi:shikimate kinase|nr:shikimate kinase [Bacteroidales bacterium]
MSSERIFIIGFMFSGKSSYGINLAKEMGCAFVDTDDLLVKQEGMPVAEMFEKYGQEWFREKEKEVLRSLLSLNNVVIATGGGTPIYSDNMTWMLNNGTVVYLHIDAEDIIERIQNSETLASRPLLKNSSTDDIKRMLSERVPIYERAHITVSGLSFNAGTVEQAIITAWNTQSSLTNK